MNKTLRNIFMIFLLMIITACSNNDAFNQLLTIDDIKNNIQAEGLSIKPINIPKLLYSTRAKNQVGYEIDDSGDEVYLYEFSNKKSLETDKVEIHNNLNLVSYRIPPIEGVGNNIYLI